MFYLELIQDYPNYEARGNLYARVLPSLVLRRSIVASALPPELLHHGVARVHVRREHDRLEHPRPVRHRGGVLPRADVAVVVVRPPGILRALLQQRHLRRP